jgi:hypothetical protein
MACLAVAIIFLYVKPTFTDISKIQEAITQYKTEQQKVNEVNAKLVELARKANSISSDDQTKLLVYMPDKIDVISVTRDIYNISLMAGVAVSAIENKETSYNDDSVVDETKDSTLAKPHLFSVSISGEYEKIKDFLRMLEQSNYPLEVHSLEINSADKGQLTAKMDIVTYSHI